MTEVGHMIPLANGLLLGVPDNVVGNEQVQPAVTVVIHPRGAGRPQASVPRVAMVQPGFLRHIGEGAVVVVVIQNIPADSRDENILVTVVVIVGNGDADVISPSFDTGPAGYVGEAAI